MERIHSEGYVKALFNEMAGTYGAVNLLSSLGFAYFWRRQAARALPLDARCIGDLMTGGAECLPHLKRRFGSDSKIHLVDWCEKMCERARGTVARARHPNCSVINASALSLPSEDATYDAVISTFGLKTLHPSEIGLLAKELKRVLKPGGSISLLEFSIPPHPVVRAGFRLYVKYYVPFLGWLFLGNPDNYRMLWRYTKAFSNCRQTLEAFRQEGFELDYQSHFFGSATHIVGRAPSRPPHSAPDTARDAPPT